MAPALLLVRPLLAAGLTVAAITKVLDRAGSRRALVDFGVPARCVRPLAVVLPLAELGTAAALVPDVSARRERVRPTCVRAGRKTSRW